MNSSATNQEGLSLENLDLGSAAEDVVDEAPESSLMDEDYAEEEDEVELEEAWSEEDERPTQYDLRQYGVYQSLPIPAGPPDLQSDCTTAEEYIQRVRYEAEQLPQTVTSHIDPRAFDAQRTDYVPLQDQDNVTAADCIPSHQWLTEFLADFASLRAQLHREEEDFDPFLPRPPPPPPPHPLPHFRDKNGWQRYCLGSPQPQQQQQQQQPITVGEADGSAQTQQLELQQQQTPNQHQNTSLQLQHSQAQHELTPGQQQQTHDQHESTQGQHMVQASEHPDDMLIPAEATPVTPDSASTSLVTPPPATDHLVDQGKHMAGGSGVAMDQDESASGKRAVAGGSMEETEDQMPDAAEAMVGVNGDAQDVEANSMSAEPETEPGTLGSTEAAPADGHPPQMAVLASLDQVSTNYLLQWHVNWAVTAASISELSMRWLYALMAQIEKPIAQESSSQLSKLLRHCIGVRRTISDDNDTRLLSIHMLIALAGGYFGQDGTLAACMQPGWL